jgi:large subunit ribosomal protein L1
MGKIRVKTLGDEEKEKQEKKEAQRRADIKKAQEEGQKAKAQAAGDEEPVVTEAKEEKKATKKKKFETKKGQTHSSSYMKIAEKIDKNKIYSLSEGIKLLEGAQRAKFDETVELHINTIDKGVSGNVTLPHGTGKEVKIEIVNFGEDPKHVEEVIKAIEGGAINFDVLIATPDTMPKLAKIARFLGPKGLMPNPKNGTVTPKPQEVAKKFQGGQINFKTEAKFPILHMAVGKVSFGEKKLAENIKAAISAVQTKNIKNTTLKSTMSPAIKLDTANL